MAAEREAEEVPIHGDILEAIFSHVPVIHLVPASHVSKSWKRAVSSSLAHVNPIKPGLTVLTQSTRAPHVTASHAYDPRSHVWLQIKHEPSIKHASAVRSSHSTLLYTLTPVGLAFSTDALHLNWHHAPPPRVWRTDPVAVEVYEMETGAAEGLHSVHVALCRRNQREDACDEEKFRRDLRVGSNFDDVAGTVLSSSRSEQFLLRRRNPREEAIDGGGGDGGRSEHDEGEIVVREGRIGSGSGFWFEGLGDIPKEMVEKVKGGWELGLVEVAWVGDFVYVMNKVQPEEVVVCEVASGVTCE